MTTSHHVWIEFPSSVGRSLGRDGSQGQLRKQGRWVAGPLLLKQWLETASTPPDSWTFCIRENLRE